MTCPETQGSDKGKGSRINRRHFLQLTAGAAPWLVGGMRSASAASYQVGVGRSADPYDATLRAVEASGEWPSTQIFGRTVVIKPNLVFPMPAEDGVTTDPEVVRALVDLAIEDEAAEILIVESGFNGANFSSCGYDFFTGYDPRVRLVDLGDEPAILGHVPGGLAYRGLFIPEPLLSDDVVFISAAKLKTHTYTHATLSMKNLVGLMPIEIYRYPEDQWRFAMHDRGLNQVIVDLNLIRPIDYAVVDGVWGMQGNGPVAGDPVRVDMVVAGANAVAVDRVCLEATGLPQKGVMYLTYAARKHMGPRYLNEIDILGDPLAQMSFEWPARLPPLLEYPKLFPRWFKPGAGRRVWIRYWVLPFPCQTRVEIVRTTDLSVEIEPIRLLRDWGDRPAGSEVLRWDGRDDDGAIVSPGPYCARVEARYGDGSDSEVTSATGFVNVV